MIFDNLVFKENGKFYIDLNHSEVDVFLHKGDNIKFSYEGKKFFAEVINIIDNVCELCII